MVNGESASQDTPGWSPAVVGLHDVPLRDLCLRHHFSAQGRCRFGPVLADFRRMPARLGFVGMFYCAFNFHGRHGKAILSFYPLHLNTSWYGILGIIGWAYLVAASVYLVFRNHRTALLGCMALLFSLYPADNKGLFDGFWLENIIGIGDIGAHAAIAVGGVLLASILVAADTATVWARARFTLLFALGCTAGRCC